MNVIERINMLKKMVGEAEKIVNWQSDIYTALHNIDATWVVSGAFDLIHIPVMDWAHISGLFPRTIADLLSDHNLANHPLAIIPVMDWAHISGLFPRTIAALLSNHNLANHPLAIIPVMDWAHISGLFPRTIAELLSDHNLANHPLAIIPTMDDGHVPDLETLSYGGAFAVAQIPGLPASQITSGQFPLSRMPRAASGLFLEGNGAADPIYNALIAANIPNLDAGKITTGVFPVARGGTGLSSIALGGILYASALDTLSRLAPTAANQVLRSTAANALQFAALLAVDIPNLDAAKITSGRFPVDRLPAMTDEYYWVGTGANVEERAVPVGVPSGLIAMWHGLIANIPAGWVICDGNNATPNLLARFVQGVATAATDPGATGGATSKTTTGHVTPSHTLTIAEMPAHTHPGSFGYEGLGTTYPAYARAPARAGAVPSQGGGGGHTHGATTDSISDIRPLFYDVAFLLKT